MNNNNNKPWKKGLKIISEINDSYFGSYLDEEPIDNEYQPDEELEFELSLLTVGTRSIPKRYD